MLPAVIFAPFVAALLIPGAQALGIRARRLPGLTMLALSAASFAWLLAQWPALIDGQVAAWSATWVPDLGWTTALRLDGLSHLFALLITGVGTLVAWYGLGYLGDDARSARFFFALLAFQGGMLVAVTADDLMLLFIGWEVTSIASFALIGFSHERPEAVRSAQHALLVTASGGLAMLAGLVLLTAALDATRISEVTREAVLSADRSLMSAALILIAIGTLTKSAQFPFHGWLPGAMSAPTPVSAYLHSATMVKLGVYLVARFQPALGGLPLWGAIFPLAGGITLVLGALLAVREVDLKRVLAYSTVSALGSMILLAGLGTGTAMAALVVTVLAHACYKAALFMVAGTIDHETGTRDRMLLGGLRKPMPLLGVASVVAALSMAGLPPAMGFLSKEKQLLTAFGSPDAWALVAAIATAGALTLVAAFASGVAPFLGTPTETPKHAHEGPPALWVPPLLLAVLGLLLGFAAPGLLGHALEPAVAAAAGRPYEVHLALWEGWNRVLAVSVVVIVGGSLLATVHRRMPAIPWIPVRSDVTMDAIQDGILTIAGRVTRLSQHGNLPLYIATTMVIAVLPLAFLGGISVGSVSFSPEPGILALVSAAVIVVASIAATTSRTRFRAIAALGAAGFGLTLVFFIFGAPDVAMTQALVETLTVILFVFAFRFLPVSPPRQPLANRLSAMVLALIAGVGMTTITLAALAVRRDDALRRFIEEAAYPQAFGRNVVNTILVDFRALDTLGEITVLAVAALGILALLRLTRPPAAPDRMDEPMSTVLRAAVRGLLPLVIMFAAFLFLRGHHEPGGGFIAGLVAAAGVALYALAYDAASARRAMRLPPHAFIGGGLAVALASAVIGIAAGTPPLTGIWVEFAIPGGSLLKLGTPVLFDLGVFLVVVGVASSLATALLEER